MPVLDRRLAQALALREADRPEEAEALVRALIHDLAEAGGPADLGRAYLELGRCLEDQHRLDEAVGPYREAANLAPDEIGPRSALAMALHDLGRVPEAIDAYRQALELSPDDPRLLHSYGYALFQARDPDGAIDAYRRALRRAPDQSGLRRDLSAALERAGRVSDAVAVFEEALEADPDDLRSHRQLTRLCLRAVPRWHFSMLNDKPRNEAYDKAIRKVVRPGDLVLDIGTGSGLLAMMAARAGAEHVVSCEIVGQIVDLARRIVADNGLSDRITIIHKPSHQLRVGVDLPRRADVLVSEIVDAGLLGENLIPSVRHARAKLLTADACVVPEGATIFFALIESPPLVEAERVTEAAGFDVSLFNRFGVPGYLPRRLSSHEHRALSKPRRAFSFDLTRPTGQPERAVFDVEPAASGMAHAVAFWFEMRLTAGVVLDAGPAQDTGHWVQAVQLLPPRRLEAGRPVELVAAHDGLHVAFRWSDSG